MEFCDVFVEFFSLDQQEGSFTICLPIISENEQSIWSLHENPKNQIILKVTRTLKPWVLFWHLKPESLVHDSVTTITSQNDKGLFPTARGLLSHLGFSVVKVTPSGFVWYYFCKYIQWFHAGCVAKNLIGYLLAEWRVSWSKL